VDSLEFSYKKRIFNKYKLSDKHIGLSYTELVYPCYLPVAGSDVGCNKWDSITPISLFLKC